MSLTLFLNKVLNDIVPYTAFLIIVPLIHVIIHVHKRYLHSKIEFVISVSDMIAIPDFVSGAMEHWGLITYRETNMLYDPKEASPANQQRVAVVVAHEISHQVSREWVGYGIIYVKLLFDHFKDVDEYGLY